MERFKKEFEVLWSDLDLNGHMRHTQYSNYATNVRTGYLGSKGVSLEEAKKENVGMVVVREFIEYKKELRLGDFLLIDISLAGLSENQCKWILRHDLYKNGEEHCCRITMEGGWIDLEKRKLRDPGEDIKRAFVELEKTSDYLRIPDRGSAMDFSFLAN